MSLNEYVQDMLRMGDQAELVLKVGLGWGHLTV